MVPADISLSRTQLFLTRVLDGSRRVLEVGCGEGQLSWRLAHMGYVVTGVDAKLPRTVPTHPNLSFVRGDFLNWKSAQRFDAIVFEHVLHQLPALTAALAKAKTLLDPGGMVVIDDFDVQMPDDDTARWFFEMRAMSTLAGVYPREKVKDLEVDEPVKRWKEVCGDVHTGVAMLDGLRAIGDVVEAERGAYLYRALSTDLIPKPRSTSVAEWLVNAEERRIGTGSIKPVGLRAVCRVR